MTETPSTDFADFLERHGIHVDADDARRSLATKRGRYLVIVGRLMMARDDLARRLGWSVDRVETMLSRFDDGLFAPGDPEHALIDRVCFMALGETDVFTPIAGLIEDVVREIA
jgi:hypothetical protein